MNRAQRADPLAVAMKALWMICGLAMTVDGLIPAWDSSQALHDMPAWLLIVVGSTMATGGALCLVGIYSRSIWITDSWISEWTGLALGGAGWFVTGCYAIAHPSSSLILAALSFYCVIVAVVRYAEVSRESRETRANAEERR